MWKHNSRIIRKENSWTEDHLDLNIHWPHISRFDRVYQANPEYRVSRVGQQYYHYSGLLSDHGDQAEYLPKIFGCEQAFSGGLIAVWVQDVVDEGC